MPPGIGFINPQIIMRAMQQRAPQQGPGGLTGFLQKPGIRDALLATGSALLAQSDQPGSLGGALGRALPMGVQAYQQGQQSAALDEAFADAPESMRRLMAGLSMTQRQGLAGNLLMQQMSPGEGFTLGPGDVRYGPDGQPIAAVPEAQNQPAELLALEEWRAAHPDLPPGEQMRTFYEARRGPGTTVNVGEQSPADKALVGIEADEVQAGVTAAREAQGQLRALGEIERILDEGVSTGAMDERLLGVRQIATAFGVGNAEELIQQENFQALSNEIAIGLTQQLSGQISERELDFVRAAVPSLGSTPEANRRLVDMARRAAQTAIDVGEARREYFRENGTLAGFEPVRRRIVEENLLSKLPTEQPTRVDPDTRLQQLIDEGKSEAEIIEIGRREGWIG